MKRLLIVATLLLPGVAGAQADWANRPQDLALLVPKNTMLLVQANDLGGWKNFVEETALGRIWAEPEMQQFIQGMQTAYETAMRNAQGGFDPLAFVGLQKSDLEGIEFKEFGFAVIDADVGPNGKPKIDAVLTARFRAGQENGRKIYDALRGALETYVGVVFEEQEIRGNQVWKTRVGPTQTILLSMYRDRFILTTSDDRMDLTMAAIESGRHEPLAEAPRFKRGVERMGAQRHAVLAYANVPAIAARVFDIGVRMGEERESNQARQMWTTLGLDAWDAAFYADIPSGTGYRSEFACTFNERRGIFGLMPTGQVKHRFAGRVPKDALAYGASNVDLGAWIDSVLELMGTIEPRAVEQVKGGMARANEMLGLDLRRDLVDSLGSDWAWYLGAPPEGGVIPDVVAFGSLRDGDKFEASVLKLLERAQAHAAKTGMHLAVGETNFRGTSIRFVEMANRRREPIPITPCWARGGDWVVFGLWPQSVKHALMEKTSIEANDDFLSMRRRIPASTIECSYIDTKALAGWAYNFAVPVLQNVQGALNRNLGPFAMRLNFEDLPPAEVITRHLEPMMLYSAVEQDCVRMGFVSSFGTTGAIVPLAALGGMSVMFMTRGRVEAMEHEREVARSSRDQARIQELRAQLAKERAERAELERRLHTIEDQLLELRKLVEESGGK